MRSRRRQPRLSFFSGRFEAPAGAIGIGVFFKPLPGPAPFRRRSPRLAERRSAAYPFSIRSLRSRSPSRSSMSRSPSPLFAVSRLWTAWLGFTLSLCAEPTAFGLRVEIESWDPVESVVVAPRSSVQTSPAPRPVGLPGQSPRILPTNSSPITFLPHLAGRASPRLGEHLGFLDRRTRAPGIA